MLTAGRLMALQFPNQRTRMGLMDCLGSKHLREVRTAADYYGFLCADLCAPRAAGSARNTRPLVSWKKHSHRTPCSAHAPASPLECCGIKYWVGLQSRAIVRNRSTFSFKIRNRLSLLPGVPGASHSPDCASYCFSWSSCPRLLRWVSHQKRVHVAVSVWLGLQAEGVLWVQRQACIAIRQAWHLGSSDKEHCGF